jgi:hypothetical protein
VSSLILIKRFSHSSLGSLAAALLIAIFLTSSAVSAQDVNPTPSPTEKCPDGSPRLIWNYAYGSSLPSNATPEKCDNPQGCFVVPMSACLDLVDVQQPIRNPDIPPTYNNDKPTIPAIPPPPPKLPPAPVGEQPTNPSVQVTPLPNPAADGCVAGTGWDFEDVIESSLAELHPHIGAVRASLQNWRGDEPGAFPNSPFAGIVNHDLDLIPAPVYGNAAPIDNIRPAGWRPDIKMQIGGDYWKYSEPVNQHGDFWISSLYRRYSWKQDPGDTWDETATGTLTSPPCKLRARFLTFRMSGGRSTSQRIELQVHGGRPADYFGLRFPGGLGDFSTGMGHGTQFVSVPPVPQSFPPPVSGVWTVVRSVTSEDISESDWMQTYVFDLSVFQGKEVRIRIVDDARAECLEHLDSECFAFAPEHINADFFQFADQAPPGTQWLKFDERRCGHVRGTGRGCSPIGRVPSAPPLWGITDVHAHPMANLGFGGHVIWGDVTDSLENVYSCKNDLPAIPGPGGREAITDPVQSHFCYLAGDVDVIVSAITTAACTPLAAIPFVGIGAAEICHGIVAAAEVALATTPLIRGLKLHGASKFSSGAVQAESVIASALREVADLLGESDASGPDLAFAGGLMPEFDPWKDAQSTLDWYRDPGLDHPEQAEWHSLTGLNKSHNTYQADMIRRAFQGGMRLGVWDVINSRALAYIAEGPIAASDWKALKDETDGAKRIVSTLSDIAVIAFTPEEAATIIASGKMAVILGTEVDELGRMRPDGYDWPRSPLTSGDSLQKQIDDLWELGIRKITPVHAVNNPIGGPALFDDKYVAANHFVNGTPLEGGPDVFDLPAVRFVLNRLPWLPFDVVLGTFHFLQQVGGDGKQSWNQFGWFDFDPNSPAALFGFALPENKVTFRVGQSKPKTSDSSLKGGDGNWLKPADVLDQQILIERVIGDMASLFYPLGGCNLLNTSWPAHTTTFGDDVDKHYWQGQDGHRNAQGLLPDGETFLRAAMKKGMILDVDHMSQKMRVDAYGLAKNYANEATAAGGWSGKNLSPAADLPSCGPSETCDDYPFMGVHSTVRGLEREGSGIPQFKAAFGSADEPNRTIDELAYVSRNGGAVGVFPRGSAFIPPNTGLQPAFEIPGKDGSITLGAPQAGGQCKKDSDCGAWFGPGSTGACDAATHQCTQDSLSDSVFPPLLLRNYDLPAEVQNDCDLSSKTFAVKYLFLMKTMGGRGLTLSTDMNGFLGMIDPRYGGPWPTNTGFGGTPGKDVCGGNPRGILDGPQLAPRKFSWNTIEVYSQRYEHSGVWYGDYTTRATDSDVAAKAGWVDPAAGPHKRWRQVVARAHDQMREDGAPRFPIDDDVYFNDHGPELPIHHWFDQDGNRIGQQLWPIQRWNRGHSGWDFNLDGLQHIGLLPDLIQDMRNVGVQWEQLGPLFRGAQDFVDLWRRSVAIGAAHP